MGWVRCTIPLESAAHGIRELMRVLGPTVEAVSPTALRSQLAQACAMRASISDAALLPIHCPRTAPLMAGRLSAARRRRISTGIATAGSGL